MPPNAARAWWRREAGWESRRVGVCRRRALGPRIFLMKHDTEHAPASSRQLGLDALQFGRSWARVALGSVALLAMTCSFACAERFSIQCLYTGAFYVSFDTESGKVVEETLSGSGLKGRIDKIDGERIDFHVLIAGAPNMDLVWDGRKKTLTALPIPGNISRSGGVFECAATELRPALSTYDDMLP